MFVDCRCGTRAGNRIVRGLEHYAGFLWIGNCSMMVRIAYSSLPRCCCLRAESCQMVEVLFLCRGSSLLVGSRRRPLCCSGHCTFGVSCCCCRRDPMYLKDSPCRGPLWCSESYSRLSPFQPYHSRGAWGRLLVQVNKTWQKKHVVTLRV